MRPVALLPGLGLAGALACTLACTLHGDGEPGIETRTLPAFDAVEVFDGFAATIEVDPSMVVKGPIEVEVGGDANALGRLFAAVHAVDTLSVGVDPNHLTELDRGPTMTTRVPALRRVYAEDASTLQVAGAREVLEIELHESASLTVQGDEAVAVVVVAAEDAALDLAGEGPSLDIVVFGRATIDATGFTAVAVRVEHHGTGEVRVCATGTFVVHGPGAAKVQLSCA